VAAVAEYWTPMAVALNASSGSGPAARERPQSGKPEPADNAFELDARNKLEYLAEHAA
jgi:hypothetical protein